MAAARRAAADGPAAPAAGAPGGGLSSPRLPPPPSPPPAPHPAAASAPQPRRAAGAGPNPRGRETAARRRRACGAARGGAGLRGERRGERLLQLGRARVREALAEVELLNRISFRASVPVLSVRRYWMPPSSSGMVDGAPRPARRRGAHLGVGRHCSLNTSFATSSATRARWDDLREEQHEADKVGRLGEARGEGGRTRRASSGERCGRGGRRPRARRGRPRRRALTSEFTCRSSVAT